MSSVWNFISSLVESVAKFAQVVLVTVWELVTAPIRFVTDNLEDISDWVCEKLELFYTNYVLPMWHGVGVVMRDTINVVRCLWNIVERIPAILRVIWELSVKIYHLVLTVARNYQGIQQKLQDFEADPTSFVVELVRAAMDHVVGVSHGTIEGLAHDGAGLVGHLQQLGEHSAGLAIQRAGEATDFLIGGTQESIKVAVGTGVDVVGGVVDAVGQLPGNALHLAADSAKVAGGVVGAVGEATGEVMGAAGKVAGDVAGFFGGWVG